jgi:hypothetical protein
MLRSFPQIHTMLYARDLGATRAWNIGLRLLFNVYHNDHALVVRNDAILAPWTYRKLLSYKIPFITGVAVDDAGVIPMSEPSQQVTKGHPNLSIFLIHRSAWETIGEFDDRAVFCDVDCDYYRRGQGLGVPMAQGYVPFYQERGSAARVARAEERNDIRIDANLNRQKFERESVNLRSA